jgi:putative Holliday junction resolvase
MSRFLGIDYGDSRIGLALSDPMKIIGKPFKTLDNKKNDILNELRLIVQKNEVIRFVVGYPINMKGENTPQTKKVDDFIIFLEKNFDLPISKIDERLSSVSAINSLIIQGVKTGHNKSKIDDTSAAIILQEFLDQKA